MPLHFSIIFRSSYWLLGDQFLPIYSFHLFPFDGQAHSLKKRERIFSPHSVFESVILSAHKLAGVALHASQKSVVSYQTQNKTLEAAENSLKALLGSEARRCIIASSFVRRMFGWHGNSLRGVHKSKRRPTGMRRRLMRTCTDSLFPWAFVMF